jgi:hypothetical protein
VIGIFRSTQAMHIAEVLSTNVLHQYRIFAILEQALRLPSGRTVVRQVVHHPGAVVIMPQLEDGRLILILARSGAPPPELVGVLPANFRHHMRMAS